MAETHRRETRPARHFVGLMKRFNHQTRSEIPALWQAFMAMNLGNVPLLGRSAYGICTNSDEAGGFDYFAASEVAAPVDVPGLTGIALPASDWAVTATDANLAEIVRVMGAAFNWAKTSDRELGDAPVFEHYGPKFDPKTASGGFEIWVPLAPEA